MIIIYIQFHYILLYFYKIFIYTFNYIYYTIIINFINFLFKVKTFLLYIIIVIISNPNFLYLTTRKVYHFIKKLLILYVIIFIFL
jgi:hypothetical protein